MGRGRGCKKTRPVSLSLSLSQVRREYEASGGLEHFLSFETPDLATIFGFLRLRLAEGAGAGAFPSHDYGVRVETPHTRTTTHLSVWSFLRV